jgi:hypothetical protein
LKAPHTGPQSGRVATRGLELAPGRHTAQPVHGGPDTVDCAPDSELTCRAYAELVWAFWMTHLRTRVQEALEKRAA